MIPDTADPNRKYDEIESEAVELLMQALSGVAARAQCVIAGRSSGTSTPNNGIELSFISASSTMIDGAFEAMITADGV